MSFLDRVTTPIDWRNAMDIAHNDLRKKLNEICHDILINKIVKYGLGDTTIRWGYNWLNDPTQRLHVFESMSA